MDWSKHKFDKSKTLGLEGNVKRFLIKTEILIYFLMVYIRVRSRIYSKIEIAISGISNFIVYNNVEVKIVNQMQQEHPFSRLSFHL